MIHSWLSIQDYFDLFIYFILRKYLVSIIFCVTIDFGHDTSLEFPMKQITTVWSGFVNFDAINVLIFQFRNTTKKTLLKDARNIPTLLILFIKFIFVRVKFWKAIYNFKEIALWLLGCCFGYADPYHSTSNWLSFITSWQSCALDCSRKVAAQWAQLKVTTNVLTIAHPNYNASHFEYFQ